MAMNIGLDDLQYLKTATLGERLRFFRLKMMQSHKKHYTVSSIGERLEVTHQSISALERGDSKNPSFFVVHRLVKEYGITLDALTDEFYEEV